MKNSLKRREEKVKNADCFVRRINFYGEEAVTCAYIQIRYAAEIKEKKQIWIQIRNKWNNILFSNKMTEKMIFIMHSGYDLVKFIQSVSQCIPKW